MLSGKTFAETAKDDVTAAEKPIAFTHRVIKQSMMKIVPSDTWSRNLQKHDEIVHECYMSYQYFSSNFP